MIKITKKKKAFIQYVFLLFLIAITTYLVSTTLDISLIPQIVKVVNKKYIILGVLLILIYILLESYINYLIVKSIEKTKIKGIGFKLATMGLYYNLVTPFASGSQPMQVYALTKYNVKFSKSVAIVTNKTIIFQLVVTIYSGFLILLNLDLLKAEIHSILILITIGMTINIISLLAGILIMFNPNKMKIIAGLIIKFLCKFKIFKFLEDKKIKIDEMINKYHQSIMMFIKDKKSLFLSFIMTFIQLTVFFSISYCVYKMFNLKDLSYIKMLTLQVFLYMSVSPIPTPGNVGANELVFLTIFANVFPKKIIGYSVFLYSGFAYYLIILVCGIFTIITHYNMEKQDKTKNKICRVEI
ncbi:lysylphosphatidylglycerol synthase transmembrane domain-containing protein [Romboutsia sp.]|uniref:lysylphosphatidylglycerol synthase transmembrane domain-containing protein n=1 Tax=Romboutsia sp. TaxID=1965302 RepID=UPI003F2E983A